jgi:uncharacterized protein YndB with AHSA1/START domain
MGNRNSTVMIAKPGQQEVVFIREFNAPREEVFRAWTTPSIYSRWAGPRHLKSCLKVFNPRTGGSYRILHLDPEGSSTFITRGVYHEVTPPERIVATFENESDPDKGHAVLEVFNFEDLPDRRTQVTARLVFLTTADRDGMLNAGVKQGMEESHERLENLLANSFVEDYLANVVEREKQKQLHPRLYSQ